MKRYSTLLIIKEMQIKTTIVGIPSHQSEWPSLKTLQITNAAEDVEKREHSYIVGGILVGAATMENSMQLPQKTRMLIYDSVIPLLDIYPNKTVIQKGTCTPCS